MFAQIAAINFAFHALQAGGGGSFGGGGGGGSGGGGGDSEGIFWVLYWLIRFAIEVPVLGVPLLIIVVVVFLVATRKGWWKHQERVIERARPQRQALTSSTVATQLKERDPAFDERRFLARVENAFRKAQSSWCAQNLEPIRAFVSDGVYERFSLQIEEQKLDGWRQGMDNLTLGPLRLLHLESGPHFDTLSIRIDFQSDIHRLELATGKRISGSELARDSFAECWSFVRRRGSRSQGKDGLMEGMCPNCGAPLSMNQSAVCGQCDCLVRSGQFDWVLCEITQMSEWRPTRAATVPGLAAFMETDEGFDAQLLEDRASIAFWRKCAADRLGQAEPLTRLATAKLCEEYAARLVSKSAQTRVYMSDCAVGSVNLLALLADSAVDRAVVEVVWDGRRSSVAPDGKRTLESTRTLRRTLLVFSRKSGEQTRLDDTFTTATCRSCGAHDAGGTKPDCAYCGAPRTGDASTWLVSEIANRGTSDADPILAEIERCKLERESIPALIAKLRPSPESAAGLLEWAAVLVRADGAVDERERRAVQALAKRLEVTPQRVDEILGPRHAPIGPDARDREEAMAWYASLVELAFEDGSLSRVERGFLTQAANRLNVSYRDSEHVIRSARTRLYGDSREARRAIGRAAGN